MFGYQVLGHVLTMVETAFEHSDSVDMSQRIEQVETS